MKCTPWALKLYQPSPLRPFAVMVEIALAVVFQDVVLTRHGIDLQLRRAQQLRASVELLRLGQMSDVAGVDQEGGLVLPSRST